MIWLKRIGVILLVIASGTLIDFFVHQLSPYFSVPDSYFTHKILYGTGLGLLGYIVFKKKLMAKGSVNWLAFTVAIVPAIFLQTRYIILEHELPWVVVFFMFVHFFCFYITGQLFFKRSKNLFL